MIKARDYEQDWEDFWEPALINRDGRLDETQIKKELSDCLMYMEALSKLYMELSGGRVSKPNTDPTVVIQMVDEQLSDQYNEGYKDGEEAGKVSILRRASDDMQRGMH